MRAYISTGEWFASLRNAFKPQSADIEVSIHRTDSAIPILQHTNSGSSFITTEFPDVLAVHVHDAVRVFGLRPGTVEALEGGALPVLTGK